MKIYEKVVIDIESGDVLQEESYEYDGPMAMCDFSPDVNVPPPPPKSETELEMERKQLQLLESQMAEQQKLKPFLYESMGLRENPETGELERVPEQKDELTRLYEERQLQALKGELPVSPALEAELQNEYKKVNEDLTRRLGPNWQLSTAGQQAMGEFKKRAELLREEARRGQISVGEGLLASRIGLLSDLGQRDYNRLLSVGNRTYPLMSAYQSALSPYQRERMLQQQLGFQAAMQSAANKAEMIGDILELGGTVGGMYLYGKTAGP